MSRRTTRWSRRRRCLSQPQYRLRVGDIRVFYDLTETQVQVLAVVSKAEAKRGSTNRGHQLRTKPRTVALAAVKDDLSKYPRLAVDEEIVITRHGRPAGILIGFASEDDWFEEATRLTVCAIMSPWREAHSAR